MPKEDTYTRSKLELEAEMAMCMGGRVAEELVMGDITSGASGDIMHLTAIARRMVCMYGMSEKVGPIKYGDIQAQPRVRIDVPPEDPCSQETAREIDLEIRRLSQQALESARTCLKEHFDELEKLAQALLERETLPISEIRELLGLPVPEDEQKAEADDMPAEITVPDGENGTPGDSL
jgi:cell division protease FtsH